METVKIALQIAGAIVALIVIMALASLVVVGVMSPVLIAECNAKTQDIGEGRWLYFGGCQVKIDGKWIPLDNYRYFEDETQ